MNEQKTEPRRRKHLLVWGIAGGLVLVLLVVLALMLRSGQNRAELTRKSGTQAGMRDVYRKNEESYLFCDEAGNVFELRKNGSLLKWDGIRPRCVAVTDRAFPINRGVAYFKADALCTFDGTSELCVAEDVACACWDGGNLVWLSAADNLVRTFSGGTVKEVPLPEFRIAESQSVLLASERYILLTPAWIGEEQHVLLAYDRSSGETKTYPFYIDNSDFCYLADDVFLCVGTSSAVFDLAGGSSTELSLDLVAEQGTVRAGSAYLREERTLYLSLHSKPELPWFYDENSGTYAIDLATLSVQKLNTKYSPNLFLADGRLYDSKGGTILRIK